MNVIYVVPYAPNKIRVRPYNLIRSLAARGVQVTVLTLCSNDLDWESVQQLEKEGLDVFAYPLPTRQSLMNVLRGALTRDPLQSFYCWHPALAEKLRGLAASGTYDVIHIEHMRGVRYGERLLLELPKHPPVIWDSVDSISYLFQQSAQQSKKLVSRAITRFELGRSRGYEGRMARLFDTVLVTSALDREAFLEVSRNGAQAPNIQVLPNGVDLEYFTPAPFGGRQPDTLVVSGKMSYHANVSMTMYLAEQIMPRIWERRPDVRLQVVGKDPPREILALAADKRIEVSGYVPDLRPYLRQAAVAVAPLTYGAGIQNKVLEAMACCAPVVTTPRAVAALSVRRGEDLLVGQTPEEFAGHVLNLLENADRRAQVGEAGRRYVETHHDWRKIACQLEEHYQEAAARAGAVRS